MIKKPLDNITDENIREALNHIQEEVQGKASDIDAVPALDDLEEGEERMYGNSLYKRVGTTIYVFASDSQITT